MQRSIAGHCAAVAADPQDATVRVAFAGTMLARSELRQTRGLCEQGDRADARSPELTPNNPGVLTTLALVHKAAGRTSYAEATARLVRSIAQAYSMQTLGSFGQ